MLKEVERLAKEFLEISKDKPLRIISHFDTDGITSASILAKTFMRLDKKFTLRIVKGLDSQIIGEELSRQPEEVLIFSDLASGSLEYFQNLREPLFILDHHEINKQLLNDNIKIINPHLTDNFQDNNCTGSGAAYLFSKAISADNKDLASIAVIGIVGDRQEERLSNINKYIIDDAEGLTIRKGIVLYPSTRPLRRSLEYSTAPYIPGVTGNGPGVIQLLKETKIHESKCLLDLTDEEMSRLITAVMVRKGKHTNPSDIVGNLFTLKFFNTKEDIREISVLINACSKLGYHDVAIAFCLGDSKAKMRALDIYTQYRQELVSGLKTAETMNKIDGKGFVILNAKDQIKDAIVGTICSMLSTSPTYDEGTILIGMAYNQDKIKVSARIVGRQGRNLKDVLEKTVTTFRNNQPGANVEYGGHKFAAGALVEREHETEFIETLMKNLEIEVVKI